MQRIWGSSPHPDPSFLNPKQASKHRADADPQNNTGCCQAEDIKTG